MTNWQPITRPWPASYNSRTDVDFLLMETWDFLLLETWDKILLENSYNINSSWTWRIIP